MACQRDAARSVSRYNSATMTALLTKHVDGASLTGVVLALVAVVLPPLAVIAPLGLAPLLVVVGSALLVIDWRRTLASLSDFAGLACVLGALSAWGMLSATWSIL